MSEEHPVLLPWYVAGTLPPERAAAIGAHLVNCPACRESAAQLDELRRELSSESSHPTAEALVDYQRGLPELARRRQHAIEAHLGSCDPCRRDLEQIGGRPHGAAARSFSSARALLAVAAALATLSVGLFLGRQTVVTRALEVRPLAFETLAPASRDVVGPPAFAPPGPWALRVLLPSTAGDGTYDVIVEREDGRLRSQVAPLRLESRERGLLLLLPPLEPGSYRLVVRSSDDSRSYPYAFTVGGAGR